MTDPRLPRSRRHRLHFHCVVLFASTLVMMSAVFVGRALQPTSADEKPKSTDLSVVAVALDGAETKLDLTEIDALGRLIDAGGPTNATIDRLLRLEVQASAAMAPPPDAADSAQNRPAIELVLKPSGRLFAISVTLADEQFELVRTGSSATKIKLSLESVAAVRFAARARSVQTDSKAESQFDSKTSSTANSKTESKTAPQPAAREQKLPTPLADNDQFVVMLEGRVETIAGVLAGITDERLTFEHDGRERSVPINQVAAIVLAGTPEDSGQGERANQREAERRDVRSTLHLTDGGRLSTTNWTLREDRVRAELAGGSELVVAAREVRRVEIDSWRLTHLSALKPATFRERPVVAPVRGWRVDRSLDGNPLRVDGREHARGIALAGGAEAEFEVTTDATSFEALVGIDDETEGRGDCVATVSVDGRPVYSQRLRGGEAARKVRVELAGAKRVRLAVEPGAGLDLGDHVDWCDARILRERRETRDSREDR